MPAQRSKLIPLREKKKRGIAPVILDVRLLELLRAEGSRLAAKRRICGHQATRCSFTGPSLLSFRVFRWRSCSACICRASDTEVPPKRNEKRHPVQRERGISLGILDVRLLKRLRQQRSGLAAKADGTAFSAPINGWRTSMRSSPQQLSREIVARQATSGEGTTFEMRMRSVVVKYMAYGNAHELPSGSCLADTGKARAHIFKLYSSLLIKDNRTRISLARKKSTYTSVNHKNQLTHV